MQVTAASDYALSAVVEIASVGRPVRKQDLAERHQIPLRFLENILAQLVRGGILVAARGPGGGYVMRTSPDSISVADVIRVIDGPLAAVRGVPPEKLEHRGAARSITGLWVALRASMRSVLEDTTIADLVAGSFPPEVGALLEQPGAWERR